MLNPFDESAVIENPLDAVVFSTIVPIVSPLIDKPAANPFILADIEPELLTLNKVLEPLTNENTVEPISTDAVTEPVVILLLLKPPTEPLISAIEALKLVKTVSTV